jgi:hypothetical protein
MSKQISTGYDFQSSVDFQSNEDVRAEDFKRLFKHQNFVGAHKGARFGGVVYEGTLANGDVGRTEKFITFANYLQRAIEDDGFILRADAWCKNITIDLDIYNVDNINTNINGADGFVATLTLNRSSGTLGWVNRSINLAPSDCTKDLTLDGEPALMEIRPTFSDNGGTWEIGQLDVFEKIAKTSQLVFRRTPLAFPEVQNDGTVEVSDADTMNFGEGITATNPSGDTAKLVGPKNTNESTSYDEVQFSGSGDVNVNTSTTAITDDSGESGTRLDVTVSSQSDAHHTKPTTGTGLNGTDTFNVDDPLDLSVLDLSGRLRDSAAPIDLADSANNKAKGELASFCTVYAVARGFKFETGSFTINYTENCSISYSNGEITMTFDDTYSNGDNYVPAALTQQNGSPKFFNANTGSVVFEVGSDPGDFALAIIGWDGNQV